MAKYEISGPDGARYEVTAPDDMAEADVMARFRSELGRPQRAPTTGEAAYDTAYQGVSKLYGGLDNLINTPMQLLVSTPMRAMGLGDYAPDPQRYFSRFAPSRPARTRVAEYVGAAAEGVGASLIPTAGILAAAPRLAAMAPTTTLRAIGQRLGETVAASPAAAVGADILAASASGVAQQAAQDAGAMPPTRPASQPGSATPASTTSPRPQLSARLAHRRASAVGPSISLARR